MKTVDHITCEAFIRAIPHLNQLPTDLNLQSQVEFLRRRIIDLRTDLGSTPQESSHLSQSSEMIAQEIRRLVKQYPSLEALYDTEYSKLAEDKNRAKGISAAVPADGVDDLVQLAIATLNGSYLPNESHLSASHQASVETSVDPWARGDRILVMAAGGAILGSMFAQVPGAVVGAILAGIYGWYTYQSEYTGKTGNTTGKYSSRIKKAK
jgi:hypothetical protein